MCVCVCVMSVPEMRMNRLLLIFFCAASRDTPIISHQMMRMMRTLFFKDIDVKNIDTMTRNTA